MSECTQFALQRALTNGGTVTLTQACSITLTNTLQITRDVVLDAGGNSVSISGNNAVRILTVASNLSVVIKDLTLTAGAAIEGGALRIEPGASVNWWAASCQAIARSEPKALRAWMAKIPTARLAMVAQAVMVPRPGGAQSTTGVRWL